jgi:hypothetical protein
MLADLACVTHGQSPSLLSCAQRANPKQDAKGFVMTRKTPIALAPLLLLAACAQQVPDAVKPDAPGFLLGLWHGFIFPVAWFLSLVMPNVAVYAVPNDGGWYDFGFFIGVVFLGVGSSRSKKVYVDRSVRRRDRGTVIDHE